jgi:hypothetical protein
MEHIQVHNRSQIDFISLDALIEKENSVRFIDDFVEKLDLAQLGFAIKTNKNRRSSLI